MDLWASDLDTGAANVSGDDIMRNTEWHGAELFEQQPRTILLFMTLIRTVDNGQSEKTNSRSRELSKTGH